LFLQKKYTLKEMEAVSPFATGDIVKVMGIGVDEELLLVWDGRVTNLPGGIMHGVSISEGTVSVEVLRSHDDAYVLYQSIMLDDPLVTKVGDAVGRFILWPT
jgi:hypothetical protein